MAISLQHEQKSHARAMRGSISLIAKELQAALGQRLTAVIAGTNDGRAVGQWSRGERQPHPETERRLRYAYQIVELLRQHESDTTIKAWFMGMNPDLDDRAPALVLAADPQRVLQAARSFLFHG